MVVTLPLASATATSGEANTVVATARREDDVARRLLSLSMLALAFILLPGAVVNTPWIHPVLRIVIGSACLMLFVSFFWISDVPDPESTAIGYPKPRYADEDEIMYAIGDVRRRYPDPSIGYFVDALTDLPEYLTRVHESAIPDGHCLTVDTRQTFLVKKIQEGGAPHDDGDATVMTSAGVLLPLIVTRKGFLIDNLTIHDAAGGHLSSLSQYEARGLIAISLLSVLLSGKRASLTELASMPARDLSPHEYSALRHWNDLGGEIAKVDLSAAERSWAIELAVMLNGRRSDNASRPTFDTEVSYLRGLGYREKWCERFRTLCRGLIDNYVIVVEVPHVEEAQLTVSYAQKTPLEGYTHTTRGRLRAKLGLSPIAIDAPLTRAFQAESYHFQMGVGPEQYVFDHHLEKMGSREVAKQEDFQLQNEKKQDVQQYVRVYDRQARPNAHLYIRRQGRALYAAEPLELKTVVELREVPPGVLSGAMAVASVNAAIITFFALTRIGISGAAMGGSGSSADIPALFIALPAFVAALAGRWADSSSIPRSSLRTYFGFAVTTVLSILSSLLYILDANVHPWATRRITILAGQQGRIVDIAWLVLAAMACALAMYLIRELRNESRYYFRHLRERIKNYSLDN